MTARRPLHSAVLEDSACTMAEVIGLMYDVRWSLVGEESGGGGRRDAKVDAFAISG